MSIPIGQTTRDKTFSRLLTSNSSNQRSTTFSTRPITTAQSMMTFHCSELLGQSTGVTQELSAQLRSKAAAMVATLLLLLALLRELTRSRQANSTNYPHSSSSTALMATATTVAVVAAT